MTTTVSPGQTAVKLPDLFIVYHTERIFADSVLLQRDDDYKMDYERGLIVLRLPQSADLALNVMYEVYPVSLKKSYSRRPMVIEHSLADSTDSRASPHLAVPRRSSPFSTFDSSLDISGSKTFSILTGSNRDASMTQSLRVQITGKAAENVDVVAILSDRSSPIQPNGNTKRLQELDNVLIEVRTPNVTTTMGDYSISLRKSSLAGYDRRLKGAQSRVTLPNGSFQVAAAVSQGKFTTNSIQGIEGNQGPYQLTGDDGAQSILAIAGSEKIWVDGVPVSRGEDQQYTIDYSTAQITFTRNHLITGDSRIVVDFEASNQQYRRNLYVGRGDFTLGDRVSFGTTFIRESDERNALSLQETIVGNTVNLKANERGEEERAVATYRIEYDALYGQSVYRYVGPDSGTVSVNFAQVATNRGDYLRIDSEVYRFVGSNQGDFMPISPQALPATQSVLAFDLLAKPTDSISLTSELAMSGYSASTGNAGGLDQRRNGNAFLFRADVEPVAIRTYGLPLGAISGSGMVRDIQSTFTPSGRIDQAEYHRRYGQGSGESWRGRVVEANLGHRIGDRTELKAGIGRMKRANGFRSDRQDLVLTAMPISSLKFSYTYDDVNSGSSPVSIVTIGTPSSTSKLGSRWRRQHAAARYGSSRLGTIFTFTQEKQKQNEDNSLRDGRSFREFTAGFDRIQWGRFKALSTVALRTTSVVSRADDAKTSWLHESTARTLRQQVSMQEWQALTISAQMIQRYKSFKQVDGTDNLENLIDARLRFRPWRQAVDADMRYEINNTSSAQSDRQYINVGRGRGNLRLDEVSGEYIPDTDGDYVVRYDQVGKYEPVTGIKASMRLKSQMRRQAKSIPGVAGAFMRNVSTDTYVAVDERSRARDRRSLYLLNLAQFQQDSTTVLGSMSIRQDVNLFQGNRRFDMRLRYRRNSTMNNQLVSGSEYRYTNELSMRIRTSFTPRTVTELTIRRDVKIRTDGGSNGYRIASRSGSMSASHRPSQPLELFARLQVLYDTDRLSGIKSSLVGITPRVTYSFRGKGRARAEVDWSIVRAPVGL
ncbi:MAG: hypothetical protein HOH43_14385, partial [Candidatus Latescibacteria bacterium]|nr:hypothetical protein [Candidatus Latescibacterota bacterium]